MAQVLRSSWPIRSSSGEHQIDGFGANCVPTASALYLVYYTFSSPVIWFRFIIRRPNRWLFSLEQAPGDVLKCNSHWQFFGKDYYWAPQATRDPSLGMAGMPSHFSHTLFLFFSSPWFDIAFDARAV